MTSTEDQRLVERFSSGDDSAFIEIIATHKDRVYNTCRHILGSRRAADAEDAAQEVFIKAYRNLPNLAPPFSISAWLYRISVNTCCDMIRKSRRAPVLNTYGNPERPEEGLPDPATPESSLEAARTGRAIEKGLASLSVDLRAAIVLREIEGLSYEEMARVLDVSVGTVKSRLARGRAALREAISEVLEQK